MLFTKVRLSGRTDIDLPFFGLRPSNTYILKAIDGLGPPDVSVLIGTPLGEMGIYQGRQPQPRQLVIRVGLNPNYSVGESASSMRSTLYGLLTPGASDAVTVKLMNGPNVSAITVGYVSKIEVVPFSKDPEVQITIDCVQPYLTAEAPVVTVPATQSSFAVENVGSVTVGLYLEVIFNATSGSWSLFTEALNAGPRMRFDYIFLAGDKLMINTQPGQRSIKLLRGAVTTNLIYALSSTSVWTLLHPGINTMWSAPVNYDWGQILYTPLYWGI